MGATITILKRDAAIHPSPFASASDPRNEPVRKSVYVGSIISIQRLEWESSSKASQKKKMVLPGKNVGDEAHVTEGSDKGIAFLRAALIAAPKQSLAHKRTSQIFDEAKRQLS